jgi:hypothetical protein
VTEPGTGRPPIDDDAVRALVTRLARPHRSGGQVIERAAILAEGGDFATVMAWIEARGGAPEAAVARKSPRGLHSMGAQQDPPGGETTPLRFILPAGALA